MRDSIAAGGRVIGPDRPGDPIAIAAYDRAWPGRYEEMRARLEEALGPVAVRIEHVGSTAIPGLAAKPVIDIQVSVADVDDEDAFKAPIEGLGFLLRWVEPGHRFGHRPQAGAPARQGQGSVTVNPQQTDYRCSDVVTLTAVPGGQEQFDHKA